jgi:crossover junction endodeoxyribonuclease RuvC
VTTGTQIRSPQAAGTAPKLSLTVLVGIDPGASGGIAVIRRVDGTAYAYKMPETERDVYDLLRTCVINPFGPVKVYLEKVGPMPKQGIASSWKFAQHYGALRMALVAVQVPFEAVAPGVWQRALGCLSHGDKNVTKRRAQELYPTLKITHATADALLIATYGLKAALGGTP